MDENLLNQESTIFICLWCFVMVTKIWWNITWYCIDPVASVSTSSCASSAFWGTGVPGLTVVGVAPQDIYPSLLWLGSGVCSQSSQLWGVLGCVSSILWELTFPLLLPRREQQLLPALCSLNTACQLACHIMPAQSKCAHRSCISIIPLAIALIISCFPASFKDTSECLQCLLSL